MISKKPKVTLQIFGFFAFFFLDNDEKKIIMTSFIPNKA